MPTKLQLECDSKQGVYEELPVSYQNTVPNQNSNSVANWFNLPNPFRRKKSCSKDVEITQPRKSPKLSTTFSKIILPRKESNLEKEPPPKPFPAVSISTKDFQGSHAAPPTRCFPSRSGMTKVDVTSLFKEFLDCYHNRKPLINYENYNVKVSHTPKKKLDCCSSCNNVIESIVQLIDKREKDDTFIPIPVEEVKKDDLYSDSVEDEIFDELLAYQKQVGVNFLPPDFHKIRKTDTNCRNIKCTKPTCSKQVNQPQESTRILNRYYAPYHEPRPAIQNIQIQNQWVPVYSVTNDKEFYGTPFQHHIAQKRSNKQEFVATEKLIKIPIYQDAYTESLINNVVAQLNKKGYITSPIPSHTSKLSHDRNCHPNSKPQLARYSQNSISTKQFPPQISGASIT